jgi:mRNA-degrading endonuclease RelE of RelBE toxin-antitoxin system
MRWTVVWKKSAQRKLAELWLDSPEREAVRSAADSVDHELKNDADRKGRVAFGHRVLAMPPLAIVYKVSVDDRLATVVDVSWLDQGS